MKITAQRRFTANGRTTLGRSLYLRVVETEDGEIHASQCSSAMVVDEAPDVTLELFNKCLTHFNERFVFHIQVA